MSIINKTKREQLSLCGPWKVAWTQTPQDKNLVFHDCIVPGCFETDLHALEILPDLYFGLNPIEINEFTQKQHIYYSKTFTASTKSGFEPYLIFEGVDCFADIYLNGVKIAALNNMLIEHEVNVSEYLKDGENELLIYIRPAREEAMKYDYPQLLYGLAVNMESLYIRKAAHMFGWDIMPRYISAGIYRQ